MYRCPECGATDVKIVRTVITIEYWSGDDVEYDEAIDERAPENATIECMDCGFEGLHPDCLEEWWSED